MGHCGGLESAVFGRALTASDTFFNNLLGDMA
jgi:hypothetical protein